MVMPAPTSFLDWFSTDAFVVEIQSTAKRDIINEVVMAGVKGGVLPKGRREQAVNLLMAREERGSTGLGRGIAIPHAKIPGLRKQCGLVARSTDGVDFKSVDGEPVHVLVMIISPESRGDEHLHALRWISGMARDPDFTSFIRQATTAEQIYDVLVERSG